MSFKTLYRIHDKYRYVRDASASAPQVRKSLMSRRINNQKTRDFYACFEIRHVRTDKLFERFNGEEACAYVLSHSACFTRLHAGFSQFIKKRGFSRIYMS